MVQIRRFKPVLAALLILIITFTLQGQGAEQDSAPEPEQETSSLYWSGNFSITNNGFSLIPSFSLGKPAALAVMSVGGERFSFDPQIYYLYLDRLDGFFFAHSLSLGHRNIPVSLPVKKLLMH